jgi:selenocysteine lyase/cysteine desulfurase
MAKAMDAHKIAIRHGDFHSRRLVEDLGQTGDGGLLRVSMVHYNTLDEVDRLCAAFDRNPAKGRLTCSIWWCATERWSRPPM